MAPVLWRRKSKRLDEDSGRARRKARKAKKRNNNYDDDDNDDDLDEGGGASAGVRDFIADLGWRHADGATQCPPGSHAPDPQAALTKPDHAFGCKPMSRPVVNPRTGEVCCRPVAASDRNRVAGIFEDLVERAVDEYGDELFDAPEDPNVPAHDVANRILLEAYRLAYPADYKKFEFKYDSASGMLRVTARGRTADRLLAASGMASSRGCGEYGAPTTNGKGLGGCALKEGVARDEVAPFFNKSGRVCCQRLTPAQQKAIRLNLLMATENLVEYLDRDPDRVRWHAQQREPFLDGLIAMLSLWTISK
jgi:hypothetical protein